MLIGRKPPFFEPRSRVRRLRKNPVRVYVTGAHPLSGRPTRTRFAISGIRVYAHARARAHLYTRITDSARELARAIERIPSRMR